MREDQLWPASLNGHTCKAFAWIQATSLDILDGKGRVRRVQGVRRWRGKAVIDRDAFPGEFPSNIPVRYTGKVKDGDQEWEINAEVFLYFAQGISPREKDGATEVEEDGGQTYVEFVGAGTPFKSEQI